MENQSPRRLSRYSTLVLLVFICTAGYGQKKIDFTFGYRDISYFSHIPYEYSVFGFNDEFRTNAEKMQIDYHFDKYFVFGSLTTSYKTHLQVYGEFLVNGTIKYQAYSLGIGKELKSNKFMIRPQVGISYIDVDEGVPSYDHGFWGRPGIKHKGIGLQAGSTFLFEFYDKMAIGMKIDAGVSYKIPYFYTIIYPCISLSF
jgi:hypothetical protein